MHKKRGHIAPWLIALLLILTAAEPSRAQWSRIRQHFSEAYKERSIRLSFMNYPRPRPTSLPYSEITGLTLENIWPDNDFDIEEGGVPPIDLETVGVPSQLDDFPLLNDFTGATRIDPYHLTLCDMEDTVKINLRGFYPPLQRSITSEFGRRRNRWHYGIDVQVYRGDTLHCAFDGVVRIKRFDRRGYGNFIVVHHFNGIETLYGHMSRTFVKIGDTLKAGSPIGLGGRTGRSTGYHLHFEIRYLGTAINPRDAIDFSTHTTFVNTLFLTKKNFEYQEVVASIKKNTTYRRGSTVVVRSGDTLGGIAKRYGTTVARLKQLNGLKTNTISIGKRLRVK